MILNLNKPVDRIVLESKFDFNDIVFYLRDNKIKHGRVTGITISKNIGEPAETVLNIMCSNDEYSDTINEKNCFVNVEDVISNIEIED